LESIQNKTQAWYKDYYLRKGNDRNDLLTNPEVLFQYFGFEFAALTALGKAINFNKESSKILDVGCGDGNSLTRFLRLGFSPGNIYGIDAIGERIDEACKRYPNIDFKCDNASKMPYESQMFDLTFSSGMFIQITDEKLSREISDEMLRVTKINGYIMLIDWRYSKPGNSTYLGVSKRRIVKMFSVGSLSDIVCQTNGALIPPIGRPLSKYIPSLYFFVRALFPFLVGSKATLLQKRN